MEMIFNPETKVQSFIYDYVKDTDIDDAVDALVSGLIRGVQDIDDTFFFIEEYGLYKFCADEQLMTTFGEHAHAVSELRCPVLKFDNLLNDEKILVPGDMVQDWSHVDDGLESLFVNEETGYMTTHFNYTAPFANMCIKDIRVTGTYKPIVTVDESGPLCSFSYKIRVDVAYNQ